MPMTHSQISQSKVDSENRRRNQRRLRYCLSCEFGSEIGTKNRLQKSVPITTLLYSKPKIGLHVTTVVMFDWLWTLFTFVCCCCSAVYNVWFNLWTHVLRFLFLFFDFSCANIAITVTLAATSSNSLLLSAMFVFGTDFSSRVDSLWKIDLKNRYRYLRSIFGVDFRLRYLTVCHRLNTWLYM